jgi:hypothetical protein
MRPRLTGGRGFEYVFALAWHGGSITSLEVPTEYCEQSIPKAAAKLRPPSLRGRRLPHKSKRDFSLRRPTLRRSEAWEKSSACSVRNDERGKLAEIGRKGSMPRRYKAGTKQKPRCRASRHKPSGPPQTGGKPGATESTTRTSPPSAGQAPSGRYITAAEI